MEHPDSLQTPATLSSGSKSPKKVFRHSRSLDPPAARPVLKISPKFRIQKQQKAFKLRDSFAPEMAAEVLSEVLTDILFDQRAGIGDRHIKNKATEKSMAPTSLPKIKVAVAASSDMHPDQRARSESKTQRSQGTGLLGGQANPDQLKNRFNPLSDIGNSTSPKLTSDSPIMGSKPQRGFFMRKVSSPGKPAKQADVKRVTRVDSMQHSPRPAELTDVLRRLRVAFGIHSELEIQKAQVTTKKADDSVVRRQKAYKSYLAELKKPVRPAQVQKLSDTRELSFKVESANEATLPGPNGRTSSASNERTFPTWGDEPEHLEPTNPGTSVTRAPNTQEKGSAAGPAVAIEDCFEPKPAPSRLPSHWIAISEGIKNYKNEKMVSASNQPVTKHLKQAIDKKKGF